MAGLQSEWLASLNSSGLSVIKEQLHKTAEFFDSLLEESTASRRVSIDKFSAVNPGLISAIYCFAPKKRRGSVPITIHSFFLVPEESASADHVTEALDISSNSLPDSKQTLPMHLDLIK